MLMRKPRGRVDPWSRTGEKKRTAKDRAVETFEAARHRWPPVELGLEILRRWRDANGSVLAGHIAYRMVVFLVPLALLLVALMGYTGTTDDIRQNAETVGAGRALAESVADASSQANDSRVQLAAIAALASLTAGWSLLMAMQTVISSVWGIEHQRTPGAAKRLVKFLGAGLLLIGVYAVRQWLARSGFVFSMLGSALSFVASALAVLGLTWMLPHRATRWIDLLPGALTAGASVSLLNSVCGWYFTSKLQKSAELYGTVGIIVTTMLYVFLAAEVVVIAVVVDTVWLDREAIMHPRSESDEPPA